MSTPFDNIIDDPEAKRAVGHVVLPMLTRAFVYGLALGLIFGVALGWALL